jgi:hypothetical protein
MSPIIANGQSIETEFPCTLEDFLVAQASCLAALAEHELAWAPARS